LIQPSHQRVLIKYLFENQKYEYLHNLLQYQTLTDSFEFAQQLVILGTKSLEKPDDPYYFPALQLGIDMMLRLKKYQDIVLILVQNSQVLILNSFFINSRYMKQLNLWKDIRSAMYLQSLFFKQFIDFKIAI
jgi:hypothetical protein